MSTKNRLLSVVKQIAEIKQQEKIAFNQINAYEIAQDIPKLKKELAQIYEELERKQNTSLSHELLVKNGFRCEKSRVYDGRSHYEFYHLGSQVMIARKSECFYIASPDLELRTVADLEDAIALCGIDKDIEI